MAVLTDEQVWGVPEKVACIPPQKSFYWIEGFESYRFGIPRSEAPYLVGQFKYQEWIDGWDTCNTMNVQKMKL